MGPGCSDLGQDVLGQAQDAVLIPVLLAATLWAPPCNGRRPRKHVLSKLQHVIQGRCSGHQHRPLLSHHSSPGFTAHTAVSRVPSCSSVQNLVSKLDSGGGRGVRSSRRSSAGAMAEDDACTRSGDRHSPKISRHAGTAAGAYCGRPGFPRPRASHRLATARLLLCGRGAYKPLFWLPCQWRPVHAAPQGRSRRSLPAYAWHPVPAPRAAAARKLHGKVT